jgi:DNA helicase-2/ATP-dependent DNA helicase PcrA
MLEEHSFLKKLILPTKSKPGLKSSYEDICKMSLYEFYDYLNITFGLSMATLKKGQAQTFYNSHQYSQLAMCINHEDYDGIQRTIHKAKGDEFDNVMVCLGDEKALDFFLQPDLSNNESHRVYYVAASRAKERLFFSIPSLSEKNRKK